MKATCPNIQSVKAKLSLSDSNNLEYLVEFCCWSPFMIRLFYLPTNHLHITNAFMNFSSFPEKNKQTHTHTHPHPHPHTTNSFGKCLFDSLLVFDSLFFKFSHQKKLIYDLLFLFIHIYFYLLFFFPNSGVSVPSTFWHLPTGWNCNFILRF